MAGTRDRASRGWSPGRAAPGRRRSGCERTVQAARAARRPRATRAARARSASGSAARCRHGVRAGRRSAPRGCPPCCSRHVRRARARRPASRCAQTRLDALRPRGAARGRARSTPRGPRDAGRPFADAPDGIVTLRNVLPDWAVAAGRRHAAAARAAGRARRASSAPAAGALPVGAVAGLAGRDRRVPVAGRLGCGCALLGVDRRARRARRRRSLPDCYPLETTGLVAIGSAVLVAALALVRRRAALLARGARGERGHADGGRAWRPRPALAICARSRRSSGSSTRTPRRCCCPPRTCGCSRPRRAAPARLGRARSPVAVGVLPLARRVVYYGARARARPARRWRGWRALAAAARAALVLAGAGRCARRRARRCARRAACAMPARAPPASQRDARARASRLVDARPARRYAGPGSLGGTGVGAAAMTRRGAAAPSRPRACCARSRPC